MGSSSPITNPKYFFLLSIMILVCVANHKFVAFIFKIPSSSAKFLFFYLIYRLKMLERKNKGICTNSMDYQGLEECGIDKPSVYIF